MQITSLHVKEGSDLEMDAALCVVSMPILIRSYLVNVSVTMWCTFALKCTQFCARCKL